MLEVKDGGLRCVVRDLDLVENEVLPKQSLYLLGELRLAVDLEPVLLAENDTVGEELSFRCEEGRRAAGARRQHLHIVRDEAVQERGAILAREDDRAASREVEKQGRSAHVRDSRTRRRALDPCDNGTA
jgi:hypothetical protein